MSTSSKKKAVRRSHHAASDGENASAFSAVAKSTLWALLVAVAIGLLLLLFTTAILLSTDDPYRYQVPAALAVRALTAIIGGMCGAKFCKRKMPLLCAFFVGTALFLITLICALALPQDGTGTGMMGAISRVALIPLALLGALLANRKKAKPKKRRRTA